MLLGNVIADCQTPCNGVYRKKRFQWEKKSNSRDANRNDQKVTKSKDFNRCVKKTEMLMKT